MKRILLAVLFAFAFAHYPIANAQGTYPNRPLRIVVPAPPGGHLDTVSREIAQPLSTQLSQQVVIHNLPGRNGQAAMEFVGNSPADGYTILMFSSKMPLPPRAFNPVTTVASMADNTDWYGMVLPAATPQEVVLKLNEAINLVLVQPQMTGKLANRSLRPLGGPPATLAYLIATAGKSDENRPAESPPLANAIQPAEVTDQARQNTPQTTNASQTEKPPSSGVSGFFETFIGGLASGIAEITRELGGNNSAEGTKDAPAGNAPRSGSRTGAVAVLTAGQTQSEERTGNELLTQQLAAAAAGDASAMTSLGARYETGNGVAQNYAQAVQWYQKAAEAGDAAGMGGLGSMYFNGTGLPKNSEQARIWFSKAAEAGNGRGMNGMGVLYADGDGGLPKDSAQAMAWYEKAAAAGEWRAMTNLGNIYAREGAAKNDSTAMSWYRKAADIGSPFGMFAVGTMHANGQGVAKNDVEAASWYRKAADAGSANGMFELGNMYVGGRGVAKSDAEGVSWYRKAAAAGSAKGLYALGYMYAMGQGVAKDDVEAASWYRKAADAGSADGMIELGKMYMGGRGVAGSDAEAMSWYRKAADIGSPFGMFAVGTMHANGQGVAKNDVEAASWYRKAADAGSVQGMFELGILYVNGRGVAKSDAEAVSWYRKAALAGYAPAMTSLGYHLYAGEGVPKNEAEGIAWERKAAALGDARAIKNLKLSLADQARRNSPQNASTAQAEKPASSGPGFFGAMLGSVASRVVDRAASQVNSAAAGSGNAALGALAGANTQLANATKEQIAKDLGGNGGVESMAGALAGNALGAGSRTGAMAALSGASSNLAGSAFSGSTGSGADSSWARFGAGGGTSGSGAGCCASASERIADNRARGAPDNFETNNERICRERKSRAHCEAGVTERRMSLGGLEKFGRPGSGGGSNAIASASDKATAAQEQTCRAAYRGVEGDPQFDWACRNAQFNKCLDEATGIPTYRVQTRTICMQLDQSLRALNSGTAASYCPLYCGR